MDDIKFIWDEHKNASNLKKHGVDFTDAMRAYYDPNRIDFYDAEHSTDEEERWIFLGVVMDVILFVVETEPNENTIRIISARLALNNEKEKYYENYSKNN
ncbi:BrnT family toxin [Deferribacterales bacterium RsTz2092]